MAQTIRFPFPLLYPLELTPLLLVLVTAGFDALLLTNLVVAIMAVAGIGIFSLWFARYAFAVFDRTVDGFPDPPALEYETITPFSDLRAVQLAVLVGLGVFVVDVAGGLSSAVGGYIAAAVLAGLAPAVVTVLALEHTIVAALNPAKVLGCVRQMGPAYFGALATSLATVGLAALGWRAGLGAFAGLAVSLYLILVVMHLLGRAAFHRRAALGLRPTNAPEEAAAREAVEIRRRRERALARAYDQRRRPESALRDLMACIREEGDGLEVHRWFHRELAQWDNPRVALAHARVFIPRLLEAGKRAEAEHVLAMARAVEPGFEVGDAETAGDLRQTQNAEGKTQN